MILNSDAKLCVGIPSEGGLLWKLGYELTTGLAFKKRYKLPYSVMMKYEHCNTSIEIQKICKYFFKDVKISYLGLNNSLSFLQYL